MYFICKLTFCHSYMVYHALVSCVLSCCIYCEIDKSTMTQIKQLKIEQLSHKFVCSVQTSSRCIETTLHSKAMQQRARPINVHSRKDMTSMKCVISLCSFDISCWHSYIICKLTILCLMINRSIDRPLEGKFTNEWCMASCNLLALLVAKIKIKKKNQYFF